MFFIVLRKNTATLLILMMLLGADAAEAQNWSTTGNTGLSTSNFVGNTDSMALIFRTNNTERARLAANGNFSIGSTSDGGGYKLYVNGGLRTTSNILINNISIGSGVGTGTNNLTVGNTALGINTTGYGNTAIGNLAMRYNKMGYNNTAIGYQANGTNAADSGVDRSVAIGALSRVYGSSSIALGYTAKANSSATALGYNADASMGYSVAVGFNAIAASNNGNISIGGNSSAGYQGNIVLGYNLQTTAPYQLLIGHATPGYSIRDVYIGGGVTQTLAASYAPLTIQPTGQSGTDQNGQTIRIATGKGTGTGNSGDIHLMTSVPGTSGTTLQSLVTSLIIKGTSGNIGIGTTTPSAQLHTTGTVRFAGLTSDSTRTRVLVTDNNGNVAYRSAASIGGSGATITGSLNYLAKYSTTSTIGNSLMFDNGSSIGIGTISMADTNYRLFVEKGIRTRKVRVDATSWADHVFKKDYKLRSLEELAEYINAHKRLPEMPDEETVMKEGVDLADNQVLLLKKVEELTLYIVQMNEEVKQLKSDIKRKIRK